MSSCSRPFNFSAGPSVMPLAVLEQIENDLLSWQGQGLSVMEMSHRSDEFMHICQQAENDLRCLLAIPEHFKILFMQGGGTGANAAIPLNLSQTGTVDMLITGHWSAHSKQEAEKYARVHTVFSGQANHYRDIAPIEQWQFSKGAAYLHVCSNETVHGVALTQLPDLTALGINIPLVVDCSSDIASRAIDWNLVGVAFAGAQKNLGPAGLTVIVVREDLLGRALPICPSIFNFELLAKHHSMYNTPPTWSIYVAGLVFKWSLAQRDGELSGLAAIEARNQRKASLLYSTIEQSNFYYSQVDKNVRSKMNVPFFLKKTALTPTFLQQASQQGLIQLAGHKALGGVRASLYNAMPESGVQQLADFMQQFERSYA